MEPFDKLNETFNVDNENPQSKWPPRYVFTFVIILLWSIVSIIWLHDGIIYISEHGLKPSIERLWEGPK